MAACARDAHARWCWSSAAKGRPFIVAPDADVSAARGRRRLGRHGQTAARPAWGVERVYVTRDVPRQVSWPPCSGRCANVRPRYGIRADDDAGARSTFVRRHIADALEHGGTTLVGGLDSVRPPYVEPVVLVDTDETSTAVQEEDVRADR